MESPICGCQQDALMGKKENGCKSLTQLTQDTYRTLMCMVYLPGEVPAILIIGDQKLSSMLREPTEATERDDTYEKDNAI
jgi:hypothetical protein